MCVQRFDDSLNSAIHITYRISLRSSSLPEPRDPLLKVFSLFEIFAQTARFEAEFWGCVAGTWGPKEGLPRAHAPTTVDRFTEGEGNGLPGREGYTPPISWSRMITR